jgi:hypothetical protein
LADLPGSFGSYLRMVYRGQTVIPGQENIAFSAQGAGQVDGIGGQQVVLLAEAISVFANIPGNIYDVKEIMLKVCYTQRH